MRGRGLLILLAILVVLGGMFMFARVSEQPGEPYHQALVNINTDQVARIVIDGPKGHTELEKGPDGWRLTDPVDYPADQDLVSATLGFLSGLTSNGIISSNPEKAGLFEVDDEKGVKVSLYFAGEADPQVRIVVGKLAPGFSNTYVRVGDAPEVHQVAGALRFQLERDATAWRDKQILSFDPAAVVRVHLAGEADVAARRTDDGWAWDGPTPPDGTPSTDAVERLVRYLSSLRALDFVDQPPEAPPAPLLTVTLARDGDASPIDFVVEAEEDTRYRVVAEADPQRYLVAKGLLEPYVTDPVAALKGDAWKAEAAAPPPAGATAAPVSPAMPAPPAKPVPPKAAAP